MPRLVEATTPLGPEALQFLEAHGSEALSTLFDLRVSLLSKQVGIAAKALLGKDITLAIETENGGPPRYLNGICTRFAMNGRSGDLPPLPKHGCGRGCGLRRAAPTAKFFQQQKVPDIVEAVLGKYGFPIKRKLSGSYRVWDYCVQYHETDLNFVADHGARRDLTTSSSMLPANTLVLADGIASHAALPGRSTVNYIGLDAATVADEEHFYAWRPREEL